MQIKLENIGIVKNSSIELNGLTVITGKNNSGKSTVGKRCMHYWMQLAIFQRNMK